MGFMGWIHWLAYQKLADVEVVAIATPEPERQQGNWTAIKGNFGPPGQQVDLSNLRVYNDLAEMLADEQVDMVDLCLPPAMHVDGIVAAAEANKHIFCEKPLALRLDECDRAMAACQNAQRILMIGHVLPFFTEFQFLRSLIETNEYGRLIGGHFQRVISDPAWLKNFYDPAIVGGPLFDLHVHDAHFIRLLFGMPQDVNSVGRRRGDVVEYCQSLYHFDDRDLVVSSTMGVINQQGRPFMHGFEVHFETATVHFQFAALADPHPPEINPVKVFTQDGKVHFPDLGDGDPLFAFEREIAEVIAAIKRGTPSPVLDGRLARDAVQICEMQATQVKLNER